MPIKHVGCKIDYCNNKHEALGYCSGHYQQLLSGKPFKPLQTKRPRDMHPLDWIAINSLETPGGCSAWTGCTNRAGYGVTRIGSKLHRIHRYWYQQIMEDDLVGLVVNHLCGNIVCFNIGHLEPCTQAENTAYRTGQCSLNTSGYRGVQRARDGRWRPVVQFSGKLHTGGLFDDIEDANKRVIEMRKSFGMQEFSEWREENISA